MLRPIKTSLCSDIKWEKKLLQEYKDGLLQFILTAIVTWIFSGFATWILDMEFSIFGNFFIVLIQVIGIILFHYIIKFYENKYFSTLFSLNIKLIKFEALLRTRLSNQEILEESQINQIEFQEGIKQINKDLLPIVNSIAHMVSRWRRHGESIELEVIDIRSDLFFKFEQGFGLFIEAVKFLKFLTLCLFFLAPYFLMVGHLLSSFLIE